MLFKNHKKRCKKAQLSSIQKIALALVVIIAFALIISSFFPKIWNILKDFFNIGQSIEDFEKSIEKLSRQASSSSITDAEKKTYYEEIVKQWSDYSKTGRISEVSSATKSKVKEAYAALLSNYYLADFDGKNCGRNTQSVIDVGSWKQYNLDCIEPTRKILSAYEEAKATSITLSLDKDALKKLADSIEAFHDVQYVNFGYPEFVPFEKLNDPVATQNIYAIKNLCSEDSAASVLANRILPLLSQVQTVWADALSKAGESRTAISQQTIAFWQENIGKYCTVSSS